MLFGGRDMQRTSLCCKSWRLARGGSLQRSLLEVPQLFNCILNSSIKSVRDELFSLHPHDSHIVVLKHKVWRMKGLIQPKLLMNIPVSSQRLQSQIMKPPKWTLGWRQLSRECWTSVSWIEDINKQLEWQLNAEDWISLRKQLRGVTIFKQPYHIASISP